MCLQRLFAQSLWEQLCPQPCNWALTRQTWLVLGAVRSCETEPLSSSPAVAQLRACFGPAVPCEPGWEGGGADLSATLGFCWRTSYLPIRKAMCL